MGVDLSAAAALKDELNYEGVKYLKLGPGKHTIRILPPPGEMKLPWKKYKVAKVGPNEVRVTPPSQYDLQAEDPTVEERNRLLQMGDEASKQRADTLRHRDEFAIFAIKRGEEGQGPKLWTTSRKTINQLLAYFADPDVGDFTDPSSGRDITIEGTAASGGKRGTDYTFTLKVKSSPLGKSDEMSNWLAVDLFAKFKVGRASDANFIRAAMEGREKEYKEQRKADYAAKRAQDTSFNPEEFSQPQTTAVDTA